MGASPDRALLRLAEQLQYLLTVSTDTRPELIVSATRSEALEGASLSCALLRLVTPSCRNLLHGVALAETRRDPSPCANQKPVLTRLLANTLKEICVCAEQVHWAHERLFQRSVEFADIQETPKH